MKTASTNKKIRELISMVAEEKLIPRPEFQRRLVWTRDDKNHFLNSILNRYPFPEIYLADGEVDVDTGRGTQLLVDGLQRVSTIIQYFKGDPDLKLTTVPAYKDLNDDAKREFLLYDVSVRDLGSISTDQVVETFKRLNATKYSLKDIEVNNAAYAGALKKFAEDVAAWPFFTESGVFTSADYKRMGDLSFALSVIATMLEGYFNRDDSFEQILDRFNDDFPLEDELKDRLEKTTAFLQECGFDGASRLWRKADLFSMLVELDRAINLEKATLQPMEVLERVQGFYDSISRNGAGGELLSNVYYKAALQASNDRVNRLRRGVILAGVLYGKANDEIKKILVDGGLVDRPNR